MPDVALLPLPLHVRLPGRDGQHRRCLRQAVARKTGAPQLFFHFADQGRRRGGTTDGNSLEAAQIVVRTLRTIHQGRGHGRHETAILYALGLDEPKNFGRVEFLNHHVLAADQRQEMSHAPAVGVKQRNRVQLHGIVVGVHGQTGIERVQVDIAVRQHHTLRLGAGAAGVKKLGKRVFVDLHDVGAIGKSGGEQRFVIPVRDPIHVGQFVESEEGFDGRELRPERFDQFEEMALHEEHARAGVIQDISKLLRSKPNVQRQQNGSRFDDTVISFEQAMAVGAQKGHAVARPNAGFTQGACKPAYARGKLRVGKPLFSTHHCGSLRILLLGVAEKANRCQRNVHRRWRLGSGGLPSVNH